MPALLKRYAILADGARRDA